VCVCAHVRVYVCVYVCVELSFNSSHHDDDDENVEDAAADKLLAPSPTPSNNSSSGEEPEEPTDAYKYQRRRSRAVLYQLSGTYGKHKSTKSKLQLNKVICILCRVVSHTYLFCFIAESS